MSLVNVTLTFKESISESDVIALILSSLDSIMPAAHSQEDIAKFKKSPVLSNKFHAVVKVPLGKEEQFEDALPKKSSLLKDVIVLEQTRLERATLTR